MKSYKKGIKNPHQASWIIKKAVLLQLNFDNPNLWKNNQGLFFWRCFFRLYAR